mmetsp:Transcript_876/g.3179  ORF Transcript_876/g.3179 Transcript_876/m.3179 type:complete len:237 (-) Transcript_876:662-1372(-)
MSRSHLVELDLKPVLIVLELFAPDALAPRAVAESEVPALDHKPWDDPVELGPLVMEGDVALLRLALVALDEGNEVLTGQRAFFVVQLDDDALPGRGLDADPALGPPVEVILVELQHPLLLPAPEIREDVRREPVPKVAGLDKVARALVRLAVTVDVDVQEHPRRHGVVCGAAQSRCPCAATRVGSSRGRGLPGAATLGIRYGIRSDCRPQGHLSQYEELGDHRRMHLRPRVHGGRE